MSNRTRLKRGEEEQRFRRRRRRVWRSVTTRRKLSGLLVTHPSDIRYLTGCTEGALFLLCGGGWAVLYVGKMYEERAPREAPGVEITLAGPDAFAAAVKRLRGHGRAALGFQGHHLSWSRAQALQAAVGSRPLHAIGNAVEQARSVKDAEEIRLTRTCVRIAEQAFRELVGQGGTYLLGRTEKQLAAELEYRMRQRGADRQAFQAGGIIVGSGPGSADCHHLPTRRRARRGEPLLFDWGAELDGYRSDITRVVFVGEPRAPFREIYEVVRRAHDEGVARLKPGVRCHTVSDAAWNVVREAGYGDTIRHGLGHGVGLDIHEHPRLATRPPGGKTDALRAGMVVTVEPGIYLDGKGGVRIEDDILITPEGPERLNRLPRALHRNILR